MAWLFYPRILVLRMGRFQAAVAFLAWVDVDSTFDRQPCKRHPPCASVSPRSGASLGCGVLTRKQNSWKETNALKTNKKTGVLCIPPRCKSKWCRDELVWYLALRTGVDLAETWVAFRNAPNSSQANVMYARIF